MCAHQKTANRASFTSAPRPASAPPSAFATNAPGISPYAATSNTCASSSVATTAPISPRMTSACRLSVRRLGRTTTRRKIA